MKWIREYRVVDENLQSPSSTFEEHQEARQSAIRRREMHKEKHLRIQSRLVYYGDWELTWEQGP